MGIGLIRRGRWLYFAYPLDRYHLSLKRARRIFNHLRFTLVLIGGLGLLWFAVRSLLADKNYKSIALHPSIVLSHPILVPTNAWVLLWIGILAFLYVWYRWLREREFKGLVERYEYAPRTEEAMPESAELWPRVKAIPHRLRHNIADSFTNEALAALGAGYHIADQGGYNTFQPVHLLYALLSVNRISNIFIRLGVRPRSVQERLLPLIAKGAATTGGRHTVPVPAPEIYQIIFNAYETAYNEHQDFVSVTELIVATTAASPDLQGVLFDLDIDQVKLANVVAWARVRERLFRQYKKLRSAASHRSKYGMDRAMTAIATPYLNHFSDDLTLMAQFGHTDTCVARDKEVTEVFQALEAGQQHVILVGDVGVGKRSVTEGIAGRMVQDDVPEGLKDKRLVRLSIPALLAGTSPAGAMERLQNCINEIIRAGNIILLVYNLHEFLGVSVGEGGASSDVASTLAENLSAGRFIMIATTTTEAYATSFAHSKLSSLFTKVDIPEMTLDQTVQVLESKVAYVEYKNQVFFSYEALAKAAELAKHFVRDVLLPGSALDLMNEAATLTHKHKGLHALVTAEEVAAVVSNKTNIPLTAVGSDEKTKLLHLEEAMHKRVVGQDEAVVLVANALRRARAAVRSQTRPIANFLFLGPTGVGKTELAKTLAEIYFGGEERMIRLDMSEYQDAGSDVRLIGAPGEKGTGVLTEAIRRQPFALLLLDELEKANKDVLNLFLQVMDDGRLTDSTGRTVDFTNTILIATSNAGTSFVTEQLKAGLSPDMVKDRLIHGELKQYFHPEFLNRFDGIVLFHPLDKESIKKIAALMLAHVAKDLETKGITFEVQDAALDFYARIGFDPEFGARPLRRAIQEHAENQLAELVLSGKVGRHDTVVLGTEGALTVRHP